VSREAEIRALLARHGFRFSKAMGQNFLVDPEVPENIAAAAHLDARTHVLEIGPGIGALTSELCRGAGFVTSIELDKTLLPMLGETLADFTNYEVIQADALKLGLADVMSNQPDFPRKIAAANLPYNITAPAVAALLECGVFETITIMIQREVARRIAANPGTKDYGAFTVFVRYHADAEILFDVPPDAFMPAPKVTSSVIQLTPHAPPREIEDGEFFFRVVKAAFAQRRKTLVNALQSGGFMLSKDAITEAVTGCGIDAMARGETLGIPEFAALAKKLKQTF
jgi:16S rRNA (adenine1518-N6/adenine1519-N6)-dimethyltransferase